MQRQKHRAGLVCPRCGHKLVAIHFRKDARRKPVAYGCPEPYCDYVQLTRHGREIGFRFTPSGHARFQAS